jgi:threonine synthase
MQFISTRGQSPRASFSDVLLAGLAPDGGLYLPESWPQLSAAQIAAFAGKPYQAVAYEVLSRFAGESFTPDELKADIEAAYAGFESPVIAPLRSIAPSSNGSQYLLELFHGPTFAFKDIALQILGRLFARALTRRGGKVTIVAATSGDTGSAAIAALGGLPNIEVFVLHPKGRVSEVQRKQMTTSPHANVHNIALEGSFDDAQGLVKDLFAQTEFAHQIGLTAVNSINFARIAAQSVYYFTATAALGKPATFVVPTGNFGDVFAGYVAAQMGLPIQRLVVATNRNDILHRALTSGDYSAGTVAPTDAPSMDIQVSSNFERLLFDLSGRDGAALAAAMAEFEATKKLALPESWRAKAAGLFSSARVDADEMTDTMRWALAHTGELLDPHTAIGLAAARRDTGSAPMVTLATAHPAKFPAAVQSATGVHPDLPARLADLMTRTERYDVAPATLQAIEAYIAERARAK